MFENRNDSLMRRYHLPSSHLWHPFPDLKQVLQNVRSQLKLFTNVRSTIWGVMHIFLVELQEDHRLHVFQTFWVVNFFRTLSDSSCIPSKTRCTTKTQWKSWALVDTFCLLQVDCLPSNPLSPLIRSCPKWGIFITLWSSIVSDLFGQN